MAWKKKVKSKEGPTITFDVATRFKWLTGFRKRKKERQRKGAAEVLEKERMDRINVQREIREETKKRWRELQWHERRLDKLFGDGSKLMLDDEEGGSRRKRRRKAALIDKAADKEAEAEAAIVALEEAKASSSSGPTTVAFDVEDDDPFGGCEVTTTIGSVGGPTPQGAAEGADAASRRWLALVGQRGSFAGGAGPGEEPERGLAIPSREFEEEQRRWKRAEALRKEEAKRQAAISRKVTKQMEQKKKQPKKSKKKKSSKTGKKGGKTSAKARRKRK